MQLIATHHINSGRVGSPPITEAGAWVSSLIWSALVSGWIVIGFLISTSELQHWFVIPVFICGVLIGVDAVDWFRGRMGLFHPVGIIGLLGYHFFFLAPLLHVYWDSWLQWVRVPDDWRYWLGLMAWINVAGLLVYRCTRQIRFGSRRASRPRYEWRLHEKRFWLLLVLALAVTGLMQAVVYASYGGILGYINAYGPGDDAFAGMGIVFTISESFPILAMIGYAVYARGSDRTRTWIEICAVLFLFLVLKLLFGGLRGSRSNTIWGLFWAAGIVHVWVKPLSKKMVFLGLVFVILFMYLYGFYKALGSDVVHLFDQSGGSLSSLEAESSRSLDGLLLGDLARADIQALTLERIATEGSDYEYSLGMSYLGAASLVIPEAIWPDRPATKVEPGTDVLYGEGTFDNSTRRSTRVYGLAGEAMLNFGPFVAPYAFTALGLIVGRVKQGYETWTDSDTRWILMPLIINFSFICLSGDSDNVVFFLIKNGLVPIALIMASANRKPIFQEWYRAKERR